MANEITLKVKVTDDGNLELITNKAKAAGKGLDNVGKSARTADRNLKGAAQTSSNTTKNFSKMAQGLGGVVVPAYAAFAAQIFALTAIFGFFQRAGDLSVLQQGQVTYAATTGTAMRTLTEDIREATNAQITFRDAAQAAAIGTAAGLTADQLSRLGKAAKDASAILGRDVTDSFNRLVRGVTKAEPELLDELGIILRLKDASEDYARALGKNASELTTFEKSQAVANNVLDQAEQKYGKILAIAGKGSLNQFNTLGAALDDVVMKIQTALLPIGNAFAKVLTDLPMLAGASLLLLASGPLKAMGFSLKGASVEAFKMGEALKIASEGNKVRMVELNALIQQNTISLREMAAAAVSAGSGSALLRNIGTGSGELTGFQKRSLQVGIDAAGRQAKSAGFTGTFATGMFAGQTLSSVQEFAKQFGVVNDDLEEMANLSKQSQNALTSFGNKAGAAISNFAGRVASLASRVLFFAGIVGTIVTVGAMIKNALDGMFPKVETEAEAAARRVRELRDRLEEVNEDFKDFVAFQRILDEGTEQTGAGFQRAAGAIGNYLQTLSGKGLDDAIEQFKKFQDASALGTKTVFLPGAAGTSVQVDVDAKQLANKDQREAATFFERAKMRAEDLNNNFQVTNVALKFLSELEPKDGALINPKTLKQAYTNFLEFSNTMEALPKLAEENDKLTTSFENSLAPMSQAEQAFRGLKKEQEDLTKTRVGEGGFFSDDDTERLGEIAQRTNLIKRSIDLENKAKLETIQHAGKIAEIERGRDEILKDIELKEVNISKTGQDIENLTEKRSILETQIARQSKGATFEQTQQLKVLKEQKEQAEAKLEFQKEELLIAKDLKQINIDIRNFSMDQKVLGFQKQALEIQKRRLKMQQDFINLEERAAERRIAQEMRSFDDSSMFSFLGEDRERARLALEAEEKLQTKKKLAIEREYNLKLEMIQIEYALLKAKSLQTAAEIDKLLIEKEDTLTPKQTADLRALATTLETQAASGGGIDQAQSLAERLLGSEKESKLKDLAEELEVLKRSKEDLEDIQVLTDGIGESIATNLTSALTDFANGTLTAKEAFKRMAIAILKDISAMIARMMVFRLLFPGTNPTFDINARTATMTNTMLDQNIANLSAKMPKMRGSRRGGIMKGYSTGGVARGPGAGYPVMLHGTEAVVPLPDGKNIPVTLKGATTQNNIVVNVSSDGRTTTERGSGPDMDRMGRAIAQAVQTELQNQKRSGGILSPYGVA